MAVSARAFSFRIVRARFEYFGRVPAVDRRVHTRDFESAGQQKACGLVVNKLVYCATHSIDVAFAGRKGKLVGGVSFNNVTRDLYSIAETLLRKNVAYVVFNRSDADAKFRSDALIG